MKVKEMIEKLDLKLLTKDVSEDALYAEVEGGYASDLLSNAMGQGQPGMVWVTMQGHQNVAAVASLIGFAAVIVAGDGRQAVCIGCWQEGLSYADGSGGFTCTYTAFALR